MPRRESSDENQAFRDLAAGVLLRAYRDLTVKRHRDKARWFFASAAFESWADRADVNYACVLRGVRNVERNGISGGDGRRDRQFP